MSGSYSLRRRLLVRLLAGLLAVGLVALADTGREALVTAQGVSDRVLAGSALAIAERVTLDESGGLQVDIPYSALEMLASTAQDQVFYRVDGPGGRFLTGYDGLQAVQGPAGAAVFADGAFRGVALRLATLRREVSTGGESIAFTVTVAESTRARAALARSILIRSALRLTLLVAVSAGIVWAVVTLALAPLRRLGGTIAERSPDDLRPLRARTPREVEGLVEAINGFMARLDAALTGLRNFTGNAAHQLRTPLATVRTQLALAARSGDAAEIAAATGKADAALARAERVLAQLLSLARLDAAAPGDRQPVDVAALAREVAAAHFPAAARAQVDLGYDGPARAEALAEPVLLAEMLGNLIDNAVTHAGAGAMVTLRVEAPPDGPVAVTVEDDGPGLTGDQAAAFLDGRREPRPQAPAQTMAQAGAAEVHGFGLAIVREIAARIGAGIGILRPPTGRGLAIRITLPAEGPAVQPPVRPVSVPSAP